MSLRISLSNFLKNAKRLSILSSKPSSLFVNVFRSLRRKHCFTISRSYSFNSLPYSLSSVQSSNSILSICFYILFAKVNRVWFISRCESPPSPLNNFRYFFNLASVYTMRGFRLLPSCFFAADIDRFCCFLLLSGWEGESDLRLMLRSRIYEGVYFFTNERFIAPRPLSCCYSLVTALDSSSLKIWWKWLLNLK